MNITDKEMRQSRGKQRHATVGLDQALQTEGLQQCWCGYYDDLTAINCLQR